MGCYVEMQEATATSGRAKMLRITSNPSATDSEIASACTPILKLI